MQASFETTILSGAPLSLFLCLPLSLSLCLVELFFGESASTKSQTSILDQGPRQPAATQLHQLVGAASPWSGRREGRMEQALLTGSSMLTVSREPAGCAWRCTVSLRWHREGMTGVHLKISQTQKAKIKTLPIRQLRDVLVFVEKVLFVCRVPLGPKCVKSHVRHYEAAQHLPETHASTIFLRLTTKQSHSSSREDIQTRHTVTSSGRALS